MPAKVVTYGAFIRRTTTLAGANHQGRNFEPEAATRAPGFAAANIFATAVGSACAR
jgi:hypothetical protein